MYVISIIQLISASVGLKCWSNSIGSKPVTRLSHAGY
jgi:hypothetical protein